MDKSVFEILSAVNLNEVKEQKNNLDYISWAWAWAEMKKRFPTANSRVYENADGWNYHHDGKTAWVKVGVTIDGLEHIEYLPVMNNVNKSIPLANITSFDVNKAIQRALTKCIARFGLGLYVYAGEDLPEEAKKCSECGITIADVKNNGKTISASEIIERSTKQFGRCVCIKCARKLNEKAEEGENHE